MADVFRARKVSEGGEGRLFVIKRIRPEVASEPGFREMFKSEARILTRLQHPNVVQLHEFGECEDLPYLAMEYLQGRTLAEILSYLRKMNFRLPVEFVIGIAEQVARGLNYAHQLRDPVSGEWLSVVHRDVTPENIFVCWDGSVKLIDFGIVKATTNVERTVTGFMKGKPAYLSPEYLIGDPVDGRADVFALGAVIWEMVAGKQLFLGASDPATVKNVLEMMPQPLVSFNPETPPELEDIVCKSLEKDPMHRYRTAEELERQIHSLLVRVAKNFVPSDLGNWVLKIFRSDVEEDSIRLREMDAEFANTSEGTGSMKLTEQQTGPSFPPMSPGEVAAKLAVPPPFEAGRVSLTSGSEKLQLVSTHEFLAPPPPAATPIPPQPAIVTPAPTQRPAGLQAPAGVTTIIAPAPPPSVARPPGQNPTPVNTGPALGIPNHAQDYYRDPPPSPWKWMVFGGVLVAIGMLGGRYLFAPRAHDPPPAPTPTASVASVAPPSPKAPVVATESAPQKEPEESSAPEERQPESQSESVRSHSNATSHSTTPRASHTRSAPKPKVKSVLLRIKVIPEGETFSAWINDVSVSSKRPEMLVPMDQIAKVVVKSPGYKTMQFKVVPESEVLGDAPFWQLNVRLQQKRGGD